MSYDGDGSRDYAQVGPHVYEYDQENRLSAVDQGEVEYVYDHTSIDTTSDPYHMTRLLARHVVRIVLSQTLHAASRARGSTRTRLGG